jgi:multidrug efflux pump subunit AcrA (membrane-fusion protein)
MGQPDTSKEPVYLADEPPPWAARGLASLFLVLFAGAALTSVLLHVPETVACPFALVPIGGTDPVRAPCDGFITTVRVGEAQTVGQRQCLFVIKSDRAGERSGDLASLQLQLAGTRDSLSNARSRYQRLDQADAQEAARLEAHAAALAGRIDGTRRLHVLQEDGERADLALAKHDIESLAQELEYRRKVYDVASRAALTATRLSESHALSDLENLRIQLESDRARLELKQADRLLMQARLKLKQMETTQTGHVAERKLALDALEMEGRETGAMSRRLENQRQAAARDFNEQERTFKETIDRTSIRIGGLNKELELSQGNQINVPAPCAGSVLRLRVKSAGTFVRTGDILCELAGSGDRLQAELSLPASGVGRVTAGQSVKLLYDAFPYQRYGVRYGSVRWVSPAGAGATGEGFRALADTDDETITIDGRLQRLLPGMTGRADVVVGRRSLLSYAFEPLRQLRENLAVPAAKEKR